MKEPIGINVLTAAYQRTEFAFDNFNKVTVSFSGGKDSTVMLHIAADVARKKGKRFALLIVDLEAQYKLTIDHVSSMVDMYSDVIDLHWVCLPLALRNAVSQFQSQWQCWDPEKEDSWVRNPPKCAITNLNFYPFFNRNMEFEDFIDKFSRWYAGDQLTATLVGIRTDESLNRYRAITGSKPQRYMGKVFTTWKGGCNFNVYPIYDWKTKDIWIYHSKTKLAHNRLYDLMHQAGLSIHQQRICQPYGDDQRKGLWLYQIIEPETWGKVVARVNGANSGSLYCQESGNINGTIKISKPEGHTWYSFAQLLLNSMPKDKSDHYKVKIETFIDWWRSDFPNGIPDEADPKLENSKKIPSWRRVCKTLLRNDYWCKGLSFTQHKTGAYAAYMRLKRGKYGMV